jgi:integrase/recombinase XerD
MNDTFLPALPSSTSDTPSVVLRARMAEAVSAWLNRSPSTETRGAYGRELGQFRTFVGIPDGAWEELARVRPTHVAAWRDDLLGQGLTNTAIARKLSVLRSLVEYLRAYGFAGANPADTKYVASPAVPRDGKTVAMTEADCRRFFDAPSPETPEGIRDRAILAVLA